MSCRGNAAIGPMLIARGKKSHEAREGMSDTDVRPRLGSGKGSGAGSGGAASLVELAGLASWDPSGFPCYESEYWGDKHL